MPSAPAAFRDKGLGPVAQLQLLGRMGTGVTIHGFRTAFRSWCAEQTSTPNHITELALAPHGGLRCRAGVPA
jgi:hypothetical protein